mmetsp:Transcript_13663/g.24757  ORF Transcript_13663/g.24757 Transcript_13663/m.24757 type:complete len:168 (+) Transcript_13663:36-539(+)
MGCSTSAAHDPPTDFDHRFVLAAQKVDDHDRQRLRVRASQRAARGASNYGRHDAPVLLGKSKHDWGTGTAGQGKRLGGGEAAAVDDRVDTEELRRRALDAAERRQKGVPGISEQRAASMQEQQKKEVLLGRLQEYYHRNKLEMPMGLNAASAEQLKKYWDKLRADAD